MQQQFLFCGVNFVFLLLSELGSWYGMYRNIWRISCGTANGFEGCALMSLFWIVIRQLAEIEAMVTKELFASQFIASASVLI